MARRTAVAEIQDPQDILAQAKRFVKNGKGFLTNVEIEYDVYQDDKPVREASGIGYLAALKAIDAYLFAKGYIEESPESIIDYQNKIKSIRDSQMKKALMNNLILAYQNLHLLGYYRGGVGVKMIKNGFEAVNNLIKFVESKI